MSKKVFIKGSSGFPVKISAPAEKNRLIAKALNLAGYDTYIVNRIPGIKKSDYPGYKAEGTSADGINYIYTCGTPYSGGSLLKRILLTVKGFVNETKLILREAKQKKLDTLVIAYTFFPLVIYYSLLCKYAGVKLVVHIMEYHVSMTDRKGWQKINDKFFDRYSFGWSDGVVVISDFLGDIVKKYYPEKPLFKLPAITDYDSFKNLGFSGDEKYFLYCGSAAFTEVIDFILKSYVKLSDNNYKLRLVLGGSNKSKLAAKKIIDSCNMGDKVEIFSGLSYEDLFTMYAGAAGLLIPLRPTVQDKARFPHKISEYLASGSPVVTTNYGEASVHFKNGVNAFVADEYTPESYAEKLQEIIDNPERADLTGKEGKIFGQANFDYRVYTDKLKQFLTGLR